MSRFYPQQHEYYCHRFRLNFFFEQIKMKYIAQKRWDSPCTRCAKM